MSDNCHAQEVPATISEDVTALVCDNQYAVSEEKTKNPQHPTDASKQDSERSVSDEAIDSGLQTRPRRDSNCTPDDDFELKWDEDDDDDPISFDFDKHNASTENVEESTSNAEDFGTVASDNVEKTDVPVILTDKPNKDEPATEITSKEIPDHVPKNIDISMVTKMDVELENFAGNVVAIFDNSTKGDPKDNLKDTIKASTPVKPLNEVKQSESDEFASCSTPDSSLCHSIKPLDHGLNKPDFMIEIPTQELIDCEDLDSDFELSKTKVDSQNEEKVLERTTSIDSKMEIDVAQMPENVESIKKMVEQIISVNEKVIESNQTDLKEKDKSNEVIPNIDENSIVSIDSNIGIDNNIDIQQKRDEDKMVTQINENIILLIDGNENKWNAAEVIQNKDNSNEVIKEIDKKLEIDSKVKIYLQKPEKDNKITEITGNIISLSDDDEHENKQTEPVVLKSADNSNKVIPELDEKMQVSVDSKMEIDIENKEELKILDVKEKITLIDDDDNTTDTQVEPKTLKLIDSTHKNKESRETQNEIATATTSILPENVTDGVLPDEKLQDTENSMKKASDKAGPSTLVTDETVLIKPTNYELKNNKKSKVDEKEKTSAVNDIDSKTTDLIENLQDIESSHTELISNDEPQEIKKINTELEKVIETMSSISKVDAEMLPDSSNDDADDMTDSLGLLAESSRVMEDDEEPEPDEEDDGDDDDDFDPDDENSNQLLTAEQSEDSNPQQSDVETTKDVLDEEKDMEKEEEDKIEEEKAAVDRIDFEEVYVDIIETVVEDTIEGSQIVEKINELTETIADVVTDDMNKVSSVEIEKSEGQNKSDKDAAAQDPDTAKVVTTKDKTKAKEDAKISPSKTLKLEVAHPSTVLSFVELEESSSEDDIQEVTKTESKAEPPATDNKTTVNIPKDVEVMCSGENTSDIVTKEKAVVITGVPKAPAHKPARLNTSEVTIKTRSKTLNESTLSIPEVGEKSTKLNVAKPDLEIVSLDSDEDDKGAEKVTHPLRRCINQACPSPLGVALHPCNASIRALYATVKRDHKRGVCGECLRAAEEVSWQLVQGIKNMDPLLNLQMKPFTQEMVEISDSDSDDEEPDLPKEKIGKAAAEMLENQLVDILNETWVKYKMDERLKETECELQKEMEDLQKNSAEMDKMLKDCEEATDKLRNELYATFEPKRKELCSIAICDTPNNIYSCLENDESIDIPPSSIETRQAKRRMSSASETPSKRPAIPLGYTPLTASVYSSTTSDQTEVQNDDELDKDVSVVKLSAESAPSDLPPPGEASRPPLKVGAPVYAMRHAFGSWLRAKVLDVQPISPYTVCRVKFDHKVKSPFKVLTARCLAYHTPSEVRMTIGTRVIALFRDQAAIKRESFYSGVVAEVPNPVNKYRYLIFFDDGYAQYVHHSDTRLVCEFSSLIWEEVHPFSREFVKEYLMAYPERPMVRLHAGQSLKAEWNGKWWASKVLEVDASLVQVYFEEDKRTEWIYRGSTRLAPLYLELQAAERHRARPLPRSKGMNKSNMPYVYYSRDEQTNKQTDTQTQQQQNEDIRRQRSVAKKSTAAPNVTQTPPQTANLDTITSRVVYYTPKNAVKPYKLTRHICGPSCKRTDVLALKDLRTYNPLAKPLLSGWERQIVRQRNQKLVMYRAPCGRRLRSITELHRYLRATRSELAVDLFDFSATTHCLAEFVLNKCRVAKKDLSHGKENVPVPCVNYYDDSLPEFCSYNTERTPTAGVPLNLDPEFLCGCDCEDDCEDKSKCGCWRMTLEGARTIGLDDHVGYVYKRLPEPLPSGIYECNSRCKCKQTCLNRVAQQPLQLKLQVFKTLSRGWGIRALNDVPKGSFLCVYAGNLLTDATANLDGLNEGDEYLAELDYIEVVEQMKEGFEDDIPDADKRLDRRASQSSTSEGDDKSSSGDETESARDEKNDGDFQPGYLGYGISEFSKRLRKREKKKAKNESEKQKVTENKQKEKDDKGKQGDDCITISDDEEVREPARFNAQAGMDASAFVSKHRSVRSHFGKDEACYIMDAKVQGNIGRYLNHSCQPNVFVQNVFVDTHDPRFPWVAFFALCHIKAGTELTWNYNYDVGSVPGKILYCHCGAPNCRGRLL